MKKRCYNKRFASYPFYGGRGIRIYKDWHEYPKFAAAIRAEIGEHPGRGYQLDRIDNSKNYEPGNVRWVTAKQNARNRRNNTQLTWNGKTQTASAWCEELGWERNVIYSRLRLGWSAEEIFTTPIGARHGGPWGSTISAFQSQP